MGKGYKGKNPKGGKPKGGCEEEEVAKAQAMRERPLPSCPAAIGSRCLGRAACAGWRDAALRAGRL